MRMTLLGTGDASGVPVYGCECDVCGKARTSNIRRLPSSALIETQRERILIDAGLTDLTSRFPPGALTRIAITHFYPDHVLAST